MYRYLLTGVAAAIEGPMVGVFSGLMLKLGYFSLFPLYVALVAGDLVGDFFWYGVGYFYGHKFIARFGKFFNVTEEMIDRVKDIFRKHQNFILFFSKVTMGLGLALATLITAGMSHVSLKRFAFFNVLGQIVWTAFLLSLGYFFGGFYETIGSSFGIIALVGFFITCAVVIYGFANYMRKRTLQGKI